MALGLITGSLLLTAFSACEENPAGGSNLPPVREPGSVLVRYDGTGDYPTIQAALNSAIHGDTILLANGRFRGAGNRDLDFRGLRVSVRSQSGNAVACVIDCEGTVSEPHSGFVFASGEDSFALVEGVTLSYGYGQGRGAAASCEASSPTFRNVIFRNNGTRAVTCFGSSATFDNCIFANNWAGAMSCMGPSSVVLRSCTFTSNISNNGGAAIQVVSSTIELTDCAFALNASFSRGGAIACTTIPDARRSQVTLLRCLFDGNSASYYGGAIDAIGTDVFVEECTFANNEAILGAGAIAFISGSLASIRRTTFYANTSPVGSAMLCASSAAVDILETIVSSNSGAPAIECDTLLGDVYMDLSCSDVFGNDAGDWVGCIEAFEPINDNMTADPLFCSPLDGNFRLMPGSPCGPEANPCGLIGAWQVGCAIQVSDHSQKPGDQLEQ